MNPPPPAGDCYTIKFEGLLSPDWVDWPCQVETGYEGERGASPAVTILTANFPDQSALYGVLEKIRDLNLKLISFQRSQPAI